MTHAVAVRLGNWRIIGVEVTTPDPFVMGVSATQQIGIEVRATHWITTEDAGVQEQEFFLDPVEAGVTYESANEAVCTVSGTGLITGVAQGNTTVTVKAGGYTDLIAVTIDNSASVATVDVTPASTSTGVGGTAQFTAVARNSGGQELVGRTDCTWDSQTTAVATIGADSGTDPHTAVASGVSAGTSNIRATMGAIQSGPAILTISTLTGQLYFADKFDTGDKSRNMNNWRWKQTGDAIVTAIPSGLANTTNGLRHRHPTNNDNQEQRMYFGVGVEDIFIGFYIHHPSNFEHRDGPSSDNHKLLRVWDGSTADGNDGYSQYRLKGGASTLPYTNAGAGFPAGSARIISEMGMGPGCGDNSMGEEGGGTLMPAFPAATAQWVPLIFHLRGATSPTANNGIIETYINGSLAQSRTNLPWYSACSNVFTKAYFEGASNQGWNFQQDIFTTRHRCASTAALADPTNSTGW